MTVNEAFDLYEQQAAEIRGDGLKTDLTSALWTAEVVMSGRLEQCKTLDDLYQSQSYCGQLRIKGKMTEQDVVDKAMEIHADQMRRREAAHMN